MKTQHILEKKVNDKHKLSRSYLETEIGKFMRTPRKKIKWKNKGANMQYVLS